MGLPFKKAGPLSRRKAVFSVLGAAALIGAALPTIPTAQAQTPAGYGFDATASISEEPEFSTQQLADGGTLGFDCYRIPSLGVAPNGNVLASWDGRPNNCSDAPQPNSIVGKVSTDNGATWGEQHDISAGITAEPKTGYSDPSIVVDWERGDVFNFHVKSFDAGYFTSQPGTDPDDRNVAHVAYAKSSDNGSTWVADTVITDQVVADDTWDSRFATSGNGIQLQYGAYKGRLVQPSVTRMTNGRVAAVAMLSDDHGATWYPSAPWGNSMDENKIVELSDGTLMNNSRSSGADTYRKVSYSTDGGVTWTEPTLDTQLPDPRNNASLIRVFPTAPEGSAQAKVLLFSNTATTSGRTNGTVRMSCDDGQTWPVSKVFEPGAIQYTSMATLPNGDIGMLWENSGSNIDMFYSQFNLSWLEAGCIGVDADETSVTAGETTTMNVTLTNPFDNAIFDRAVSLELPEGWQAEDIRVSIPSGESVTIPVQVIAPLVADNGELPVEVSILDGADRYTGRLNLTVQGGQEPAPTSVKVSIPNLKDTYVAGEKISINFAVDNPFDVTVNSVPSLGEGENWMPANLRGFDPEQGTPNCRYKNLGANRSYDCTTTTYEVSDLDVERGYVDIPTVWTFTNSAGETVWSKNVDVPRIELNGTQDAVTDAIVTVDPINPVHSNGQSQTVKVQANVTSKGDLPAGSTVIFYLDSSPIDTAAVDAEGHASISIDVDNIASEQPERTFEVRARLVVPEDAPRSIARDALARFTVLPEQVQQNSLVIMNHPDVVSDGQTKTIVIAAKATAHDGSPVAIGTLITFRVNGIERDVVPTNAQGTAKLQLDLKPVNTEDEEYEVTVESELDELTAQTTFKVLAGEEEEPTSTEEQPSETEQPTEPEEESTGVDGSSNGGSFVALLALLAALGGIVGAVLGLLKL
ncbi:exo-alpha-sialidase [Corynebacterium glutamicum]|uniref:exo-alpha-sialidase n=1 Tax=Corynebacterium glutamicum TaxID=1718 RepID=UPI001B8CF19F|nr:exo-alpha-sialidase [Corynebacterium glutamicum]